FVYCFIFFFFSSRRRHTRSKRDWSSDVCSSDLVPVHVRRLREPGRALPLPARVDDELVGRRLREPLLQPVGRQSISLPGTCARRSEERRVGKECRSRWGREREKKKVEEEEERV